MSDEQQPIETPYAQRVEDFKRRKLPIVVWSVALLTCGVMLFNRAARFEYIGIAEARQYEISAATTGTLDTVVVSLYDSIEAGDVVAKLDDTQLRASIETAGATIRQLGAELEAAKVEMLAGSAAMTADLRRFQIDEEQRRLDGLGLRVVIETAQIELERLALEVNRQRPLLESGLIGQMEFDRVRLQHDQVLKGIQENQVLLAETEDEYHVARERRERYEVQLPNLPEHEPMLLPVQEAIAVESRRLREIELLREALVLRSPVAGQVSALFCSKGQAVVPGEPILTIAERVPREIIAYVAEADTVAARENSRVLVTSQRDPSKVAESLIVRVSPAIEPLPQRMWRDPRIPDYGRAVVIAGVPALELTPGELVHVRFVASD